MFQGVDHTQALQIVFKTTKVLHTVIERVLPRVAKRRMAQVVCQGNRFDQVFIQT